MAQVQMQEARLRERVTKQREINRIIKDEQTCEHQKNLQIFADLNKEELLLRKELANKQRELTSRER